MAEPITTRIAIPSLLRGFPALHLARQGALALGLKIATAGSVFVVQVCLARMLGHDGFGQYSYAFAWLQLMLIGAQGGFSMAALRYVAEYRTRGELMRLRGFLRFSSRAVLVSSVALAIVAVGIATVMKHVGVSQSIWNIVIVGATLPILAQTSLSTSVVRGLGRAIPSMAISLVQPLLLLCALFVTALVHPTNISPAAALLLNLGATVGFLGVIHAAQRQLEKRLSVDTSYESCPKEWLGTATPMLLIAGLVYLQGRTGVIISGLLIDASVAGTYAAAERLADLALLGLLSVNYLVAPAFSSIHAQGRRDALQRYARLAALGSTVVMLVVTVPLVVFGRQALRVFGEDFVAGYPVLLLLLGGVAVNAMCGSSGILLQMTGHHGRLMTVLVAGLTINIALSCLLVPSFGIVGVAWANTIAVVFWNVGTVCTVRARLGIWPHIGRIDSTGII